ncbi:MAG: hypothetical protein V1663_05460 [archaeon]
MKRGILFFLLVFFLSCTYFSTVNAEEIVINVPRSDYRVYETFQAEIFFNINPVQVSVSNFELRDMNNIKIATPLFLEKISDNYYFVYFDLPNLEKGQYKFWVKNINYVQNGILKETGNSKIINVDNINSGFAYISSQQNIDGSFGNIKETALASLALKNTYYDKANNAINYLINNQDPTGCYPKNNCNVEDTSFALLALDTFDKNIVKTKNWLKDASNNFELGTWNLIINGVNANCTINNQNFLINQELNFILSNNNLLVNCSVNVTMKLMHGYLGNSYEIFNENAKYKNYSINDNECYGYYYKSNCNYQSTGYANFALKNIGEETNLDWYKVNSQDTETLYYALLYLIEQDDYSYDWLMNNLQVNYWSDKATSINQDPNNYVSAFAAYALKEDPVYSDVKNYLKDKTSSNVQDGALILYFLFNDEIKLPSVSINPGIVNNLDFFLLRIKNNNLEPINVQIIAPNFTALPSNVLLQNELTYNINLLNNLNLSSFNIEIKYDDYNYIIPVLTEIQTSFNFSSPLILLPPAQDSIEIIDEENEVINEINNTLNYDDRIRDSIFFKNKFGFTLHNITLILTGNLDEIIKLDNYNYDEIESNETIESEFIINDDRNPEFNEYSGYLIINSYEGTFTSLPIVLYFITEEENVNVDEDEIEPDINESISDDTNKTGTGTDGEEKKSKKWLWIIPIVLILIIGIVIIYLNSKKKEVKSFDDFIGNIKR